MAEENIIDTIDEIRANQPAGATLDPNDLVYVLHGTGSDRDRVFRIQDIYDGSKEFVLFSYGTSTTSQDIVNAYKAGKIPVIVGGGSSQSAQERTYYFPKKIQNIDSGYGSDINRDCEFYGVGRNATTGHIQITYLRYYNIPVQGQGEIFSATAIDLDSPTFGSMLLHHADNDDATLEYDGTDLVVDKPVQSESIGNVKGRLHYDESTGQAYLEVKAGNNWLPLMSFQYNQGTSYAQFHSDIYLIDSAKLECLNIQGRVSGQGTAMLLKLTGNVKVLGNGSNTDGDLDVAGKFKAVGGHFEVYYSDGTYPDVTIRSDTTQIYFDCNTVAFKNNVNVQNGTLTVGTLTATHVVPNNIITISGDTDLTGSTYTNGRSTNEIVYLKNNNNATATITIRSGVTRTIPAYSLMTAMYVGSSNWILGTDG